MNKLRIFLMSLKKKKIIVTAVIAVFVIGVCGFFFVKYQKAQTGQLDAQDLVKKVSRFISLPENELPTIATVSDYEKLKDQPFFEKSQNGDKVLIYTKAKKAYLYRPSADKLIDVTIVNIESSVASPIPSISEIKIVLRNGTSSVGLTNKLEPDVKKALPNVSIVKKENAVKNDYQTTSIIVLSESVNQAASQLADYLKATITSLPAEESKPENADLLIIIGKDKVPSVSQ